MNAFVPGPHVHYKGDLYDALYLARLSEDRSKYVVVYRSVKTGDIWVRPFEHPLFEGDDCWCDVVEWPDGVKRPRFVPLTENTRGLLRC